MATNQIYTSKRAPTIAKAGSGIKVLLMGASLAATIGGWGILALGQTQDALAAAPQPQVTAQPANNQITTQSNARTTNSTTTSRQINPSLSPPRAAARSRSSR